MKISKELASAIILMKQVAKEQKVSLRIYYRECAYEAIGTTYYGKRIRINMYVGKHPVDYILSVFFHELGHVHCQRKRIYPGYHGSKGWVRYAKAVVFHGIQAERYVDSLGKKMAKEFFPTSAFKWYPSYKSKEDVEWFNKVSRSYWLKQLQLANKI